MTISRPTMMGLVIPISAAPLIAELRIRGTIPLDVLCSRFGTDLAIDLVDRKVLVVVAVERLNAAKHRLLVGLGL